MQALQVILAVIGGVGTVLGALAALIRPLRRIARNVSEIRDDWYGQPARPGRHREPGVLERLTAIEAELRPNHGASLRDAVGRIESALNQHLRDHRDDRKPPPTPDLLGGQPVPLR